MTTFAPTSLVRRALLADAVVSGITGAMLTFTAPLAAQLFGLPDALLRTAGLFCVVFGAAMVWLSRMPALSPAVVRAIVAGNVLWVVASAGLMLLGPSSITAAGLGFVGFQAAVVAVLAEAQWMGLLRRPVPQTSN